MKSTCSCVLAVLIAAAATSALGYDWPFPVPGGDGSLDIEVTPKTVRAGDKVVIRASVDPILEPFDAWGTITLPDGRVYSMTLGNALEEGGIPIVTGIPLLPLGIDMTLLDIEVPSGIPPGKYRVFVALIPPGTTPSGPGDAIDGYADEEALTVLAD